MASKKRRIILHAAPFFTMAVLSPGEVYKRETYGLLFSFSNKNIINLAYSCQTTERKFVEAEIYLELDKYLRKIAENFDLNFVGDFHSHTDCYHAPAIPELASQDKKWLKKNPGLISIVLAINSKWNNLKVDIRGFYYDSRQDKIKEINIALSKKLEKILETDNLTLSSIYIEKQKKDKFS
jgi:proteasome lid subunit RPN8/RPN11